MRFVATIENEKDDCGRLRGGGEWKFFSVGIVGVDGTGAVWL